MMYSPFRYAGSVLWKRNPIQLTFFLTSRCNARCNFCFYVSKKKSCDPSQELTVQEIKKVAPSFGRLLWLAFSGGEIFLRKDLVEIAAIFYRQNKPAIILLPTNGLLTEIIVNKTEEILQNSPKSTIVVKLSVDGPATLHDTIRGVSGAYEKTMATYNALAELLPRYPNFDLGINTVFCTANQNVVGETLVRVGKMENVKTHTISLIRGSMDDMSQKNVDIRRYLAIIEKMATNLREKKSSIYRFGGAKLKAAQDILQRKLIYETANQNRQLLPCYAGRLNLVLTETGDLYPCESFSKRFGNIRENDYDARGLLKTKQAGKIINSIKNGCFCTHECYMMTNILFNPAMYPALLKEYLRL